MSESSTPSRFLSLYEQYHAACTDAPMDFAHAVGLSVLSTVCCGRRWLPSGTHPNLYVQLVAGSSKDRKSYSINLGIDLLRQVEPDRIGPEDYSPEALLGEIATVPNSPAPPKNKLLLPVPEFGDHLATGQKSYGFGQSAMLTKVYDGTTFERIRVNKRWKIEDPRIGMLGGVAFGMLERYADPLEWVTGFFSRICWVTPTSRRTPFTVQPPRNEALGTAARIALQALRDVLDQFSGPMAVLPEAEAYFAKWAETIVPEEDPAAQASRERLMTSTWKVAIVYQVDEDPSKSIGLTAISKACSWAGRCWHAFKIAYTATSGKEDTKLTNRLWETIANAGDAGIARRDLAKKHKRIPIDRVMTYIKNLLEVGVITAIQTGEDRTVTYRAVVSPSND